MKKLAVRLIFTFITFGVTAAALQLAWRLSLMQTPVLASAPPLVQVTSPTSNPVSLDEEYAVYSVLLNKFSSSPEDGRKVKLLVINDQTTVDEGTGYTPDEILKMYMTPTLSAALRDYKTKNRQPRQLTKSFDLKFDYVLVPKKEFNVYFKGKNLRNAWESYYRKYPDSPGYISLSRVGFSSDITQAVVYMEYFCGNLCADGSYIILSKENGEWKETKQVHFWAS